MLIGFWTGFLLLILIGLGILIANVLLFKKTRNKGGVGGLLGFFIGAAFVLVMLLLAGRLYVVTGDAQFDDYLVYGTPEFEMSNKEKVSVHLEGTQCMVINDWDKPVIVEYVVYGGYGFGGDTKWIDPSESSVFDHRKVFYFYDDEPPSEISIKSNDDEVTRLWLRNKR